MQVHSCGPSSWAIECRRPDVNRTLQIAAVEVAIGRKAHYRGRLGKDRSPSDNRHSISSAKQPSPRPFELADGQKVIPERPRRQSGSLCLFTAEIRVTDTFVAPQRRRFAAEREPARLKHITPVCDLQRHMRVLLNQ